MRGIFYKEGIYVVIDNNQLNDLCVFQYTSNNYYPDVLLYGGRINLKYCSGDLSQAYMTVDGVTVLNFVHLRYSDGSTKIEEDKKLSFCTIASHLNAIEANGVDSFIQNYKQSIEFLYCELKEYRQKTEMQLSTEQNESEVKTLLTELEKLRDLLFSVLAILFSLQTYMTAGLENVKVMSVCQSIMDSLS